MSSPKERIRQLTDSYHQEQYAYLVKYMRYTEAKRDPANAPATGLYSLQWWEYHLHECRRSMKILVRNMRAVEAEWKDWVLKMEEERAAAAVRREWLRRRKRQWMAGGGGVPRWEGGGSDMGELGPFWRAGG